MAEKHLDASRGATLARYYDLDVAEDTGDLDLYRALARQSGGPILELAAGTGRIAIPLAADGFAVTAVDLDPDALARAKAASPARPTRHGSLDLVEADLLTLDLPGRFALVILAFNSLLLLGDRSRQVTALSVMARHLRPDGVSVIDVWLPSADDLAAYDGRLTLEWVRDDPATGERVAKMVSATYDAATSTVTLTQLFDAWPTAGGPTRRVDRVDAMRLVSAGELMAMAEEAGLQVERLGGDHEMTPFGPGAERVILMARPKGQGGGSASVG